MGLACSGSMAILDCTSTLGKKKWWWRTLLLKLIWLYSCQNLGGEAINPLPPSLIPTALSQSRQTWHIKLSIYAWIPTLDSRFGKVASVQIHRSVSVYDNWCFADGTFRNFHTWFFALKDTYDSWPSTEGLCCSLQARWNNFKVGWDQQF